MKEINMLIYENARAVPNEAKKTIGAGRLKGFTDVNPMWRIKKLTELFGACGVGWWYEITEKRLEKADNGEVKAFVDILLYYGDPETGETSKGIPGTGGSSFISNERSGQYVSDECFKMALTDALSVAAKALGVGADVYFDKDRTKYSPNADALPLPKTKKGGYMDDAKLQELLELADSIGWDDKTLISNVRKRFGKNVTELDVDEYTQVVNGLCGVITNGKADSKQA